VGGFDGGGGVCRDRALLSEKLVMFTKNENAKRIVDDIDDDNDDDADDYGSCVERRFSSWTTKKQRGEVGWFFFLVCFSFSFFG
jgi:hypothetical protein